MTVPQGAVLGGIRLDLVMIYATPSRGRSWPFLGEDPASEGTAIYCGGVWWPAPLLSFLILDLPISFALDLVFLPITAIIAVPDPKSQPSRQDEPPDSPRRE